RRGGDVNVLGEGDQIPLGVLRDYEYRNNELVLEPSDQLLFYTDGLTEARDRRERMFGVERLRELLSTAPQRPGEARDAIVAALHEHQSGPIGTDDQTLIVLRVTE